MTFFINCQCLMHRTPTLSPLTPRYSEPGSPGYRGGPEVPSHGNEEAALRQTQTPGALGLACCQGGGRRGEAPGFPGPRSLQSPDCEGRNSLVEAGRPGSAARSFHLFVGLLVRLFDQPFHEGLWCSRLQECSSEPTRHGTCGLGRVPRRMLQI